jgi:hypothetical protein
MASSVGIISQLILRMYGGWKVIRREVVKKLSTPILLFFYFGCFHVFTFVVENIVDQSK